VALGGAHVVSAEETLPASSRALADTPFQLVLPQGHLLGDWHGLRTWLEGHGVTPGVTFVTDALGNPTGGVRQGFRGASNLGVDLRFDLEKLTGLAGASFQVSFSERFGSSLSAEDIGNVFTVQQVFGGQTYRIVDAAYQQRLLGDRIELRVGRIAAGDDFLVSPYNYVFVQNGFDGNPVGVFFNAPGMTAYPNATWGGVVKARPTERMYVMGGLYNGDPAIRANRHHGADWSMDGPLFAIGEAGYQINGLPGDGGPMGNYKAGFWYDDSRTWNSVAAEPPGGTGVSTACSIRCWCGSAEILTVGSGSPARFSSRPISRSAGCRSSPPPACWSAACSRHGRPTWGASGSSSGNSATICGILSGARGSWIRRSACSGTRSRSS
jgi:carbohydrate-selective porin OprB